MAAAGIAGMGPIPPDAAPLEEILITAELDGRAASGMDPAAELDALHDLARAMVEAPAELPQRFAEAALALCGAGSAGISLLETTDGGEAVFRWVALAGAFEPFLGGSTPRGFSPCGTCLDRGGPVLLSYPARRFTYLAGPGLPEIVEGLIAPLGSATAESGVLGTLWVVSHDRSIRFDAGHLRSLRRLADFTVLALRGAAEAAERRAGEERLRAVLDGTPECVKVVAADGRLVQMNPAGLRILDAVSPSEVLGRPLTEFIAPEHRARWQEHHARVCAGEALVWEFDFVGLHGRRRSMETHAVPFRLPGGGPTGHLGVTRDVTERRAAEARQALLMRELDHRAKNALAVVHAAVRLTRCREPAEYARAVEGRIAALARAHTLLAEGRWDGAEIGALLRGALAPFGIGRWSDNADGGPRLVLSGPSVLLQPAVAQTLALAVHEMATNATKHGALSQPCGRVELHWAEQEGRWLRLSWLERGGPAVAGPPLRRGFGMRMLDAAVRGQLGGLVEWSWRAAGLSCEIVLPLRRTDATGQWRGQLTPARDEVA